MASRSRLAGRKSKVTVKEVAARAQVSESTVSRILRNKGPIAEETRRKVMEAVRTMGYVPNRIAGALASLNSNVIGVVVPSLSNIVFPEVLQGAKHALADRDEMQAVISISDYDSDREETLIRGLLSWKPAAILTTGFEHTDATRRMLDLAETRVVEMMEIDADPIDVAVGMSHRRAGYETGRYLVSKGYRRFGYVGHDLVMDYRAKLRFERFRDALRDAGLAIAGRAIAGTPSSVAAGKAMTAQLLAGDAPVDVIVYSNDDMAVGGVFHCLGAGVAVPGDVALFGFNGLDIGKALPQPLSTVRSNRFLIGQASVKAILDAPNRPARSSKIDTGFEIFEGATA